MSQAVHNKWRRVKLKDVCDHITVGFVGTMSNEYVDYGIPMLRSKNIIPFGLNLSDLKYIPNEFHEKIKKSAIFPGNVVVVRTGYPGTACVIPDTLPNSNCSDLVIIRPSEEINGHFLAAIFNSNWGREAIGGRLVGVAQQHFNVTVAKEFEIDLPPLPIQQRIAAVLSAYDDLIENNRQRIEALEAAAQALYREWFVEMRFPGWQDVEWVESELGVIPAGWEVAPLSDAIEINPRHSLPNDTEKYYVPMAGLSENSMLITEYSVRTGRSGAKFKNGDTLFARITPSLENGKTGYVQFLPSDDTVAIGSTEFIVMRSKSLCPEFVYLLARSHEVREPAIGSMTGASGRQRVQYQVFDEIYIPQPDHQILRLFQEQVSPSFELIRTLSERNVVLRETRDLLLPRLISGEVSVEELPLSEEDT